MAFTEDDFDEFMQSFAVQGAGGGIKELYDIMPYLKSDEIQIINDALYFADQYQIPELRLYIERILEMKKRNRNIGFFPNFRQMLRYKTLEDKFRGYKMNQSLGGDQ